MFKITKEPLSVESIIAEVNKSGNGGICTFVGTVRDNAEGKGVLHLEYDAYTEMAEKKLADVAAEIKDKWGLDDVAIVHRIGKLEIGEAAVVIAVGAPHRKGAFEACQYAIDRIKEYVPIWKKEFFEDGDVWVKQSPGH
ncbi:molybdenum cofactor biosynthesis protein MoaE [Chloroflexota bacterium]